MNSPYPAPWSLAARAAYFGEVVCAFCDHHSPAGSSFCNHCGAQLNLKPCKLCDAVNHQTATACHNCGAEYPALVTVPWEESAWPAAGSSPPEATPEDDLDVPATATQPPSTASTMHERLRLIRPDQFLLAYLATILIAGAYAALRTNTPVPDGIAVASQAIAADEPNAHTAASATTAVAAPITAPELTLAEPEATVALQAPALHAPALRAPISLAQPETRQRTSVRQRPAPVSAPKRASAQQRRLPATRQPDPRKTMHVSQPRSDVVAIERGQ